MSKASKTTLPDHEANESLTEHFGKNIDEITPKNRKKGASQAIEEAFQAKAKNKSDVTEFHTISVKLPPTEEIGSKLEPAPKTISQSSFEKPNAKEQLFGLFLFVVSSYHSIQDMSPEADVGENIIPISDFHELANGGLKLVLKPFPYEAQREDGSINADLFDADLYSKLKRLFDELDSPAEAHNVQLIHDHERAEFHIICESAEDFSYLIQTHLQIKGIHTRETLYPEILLPEDAACENGAPCFTSPQQHKDYLKESVLKDRDVSQDLYASSPDYFLDGLPSRIYIDFAQATSARYYLQLIEDKTNIITARFSQLRDELSREDNSKPLRHGPIDPLLRLH